MSSLSQPRRSRPQRGGPGRGALEQNRGRANITNAVDRAHDVAVSWPSRVVGTGPRRWVFFAAVALAIFSAPDLPARPSLALNAVATLAAAAWCLTNFWHCQEAHCLVTGPGWGLLGVFEVGEVGIGHSLIGGAEQVPSSPYSPWRSSARPTGGPASGPTQFGPRRRCRRSLAPRRATVLRWTDVMHVAIGHQPSTVPSICLHGAFRDIPDVRSAVGPVMSRRLTLDTPPL